MHKMSENVSIKYRPEIDGLRTVAVLSVVLFHFKPNLLPGGFAGVDVFFVISGYLITSILINDFDRGEFTFRDFWSRRARRIFPAYGFLIICSLFAGWWLLFPTRFELLGTQALGATTFVANHTILSIAGNYWDQTAESLPLLHLWSLAVEEQFYILLPLFLWITRRQSWAIKAVALLVAIAVSYGLSVWLTPLRPGIAYFLLPTRLWELGFGCVIALGQRQGWFRAPSGTLSNLGFALIIGSLVLLKGDYGFPGALAIFPVAGAALFITNAPAGGIANRIMSADWVAAFGKMSFSLYLWHWPAIIFSAAWVSLYQPTSDHAALIAALAATVIGTTVSYFWIERWGKRLANPLLVAGCALPAIAVSAALVSHKAEPQDVRPGYRTAWMGDKYDCFPDEEPSGDSRWNGIATAQVAVPAIQRPRMAQDILVGVKSGTRIMVLGDSHALTWGSLIERICFKEGLQARFFCTSGRGPGIKFKGQLNAHETQLFVEKQLLSAREDQPRLIIVAFRMDHLRSAQIKDIMDFLEELHRACVSAKILIIQQPPLLMIDNVSAPSWLEWKVRKTGKEALLLKVTDGERREPNEAEIKKYAGEHADYCRFFELPGKLKVGDRVRVVSDSGSLYADDDHLSEVGAAVFEPELTKVIADWVSQ